jgi:CubicO group peptidase (beta-lactamase class C family)
MTMRTPSATTSLLLPTLPLPILLLPLLLPAPRPLAGQFVDPGVGAADSLVAAWVTSARVPGAVLRIERKGVLALERSYGWARANDFLDGEYGLSAAGRDRAGALRRVVAPAPMTPGTVFDLASVTKVMATTFAVMMLVDRGEMALDAPVSTYLPDFRGGGKEGITVRHLLTHRSGLLQWVPLYYRASEPDAAYRLVVELPLGWPVGEGRHYSDLGFMVLGRAVEAVAGASLDGFLRQELYGPMGLTRTGFRPGADVLGRVRGGPYAATSHGNPYEHRMVHDSTFGYRIPGDPLAWNGWRRYTLSGEVNDGNAFHAFGGVAGHAGLFSNAGELSLLVRLLLGRGVADGRRYIESATVDTFLTSTGEGQALGWQSPDYAPPGSFAHTGFTGTFVLGVPAEDLSVVLLTNRQNGGVDDGGLYPDVGPLQRAVASALLSR